MPMKHLLLLLITTVILQPSYSQSEPTLKIGLVADPQFADRPVKGNRYYKESLWKLQEAVVTFNDNHVDFVQNLGDIIDGDWNSYDSILPIYQNLEIPNYHVLGNHDFDIDSIHFEHLLERLSMPDYYYSFTKKDWRFIILDATDYSYYSNPLHKHDINLVDAYFNHSDSLNHYKWNSAIGEKQQNWLSQELDSAALLSQKVIIFSHLPVRPLANEHNLWNNHEIIQIIENSSNVVAFINGHNHAGAYVFKNGIHYITVFGMVDTMISSYGILEIYTDSLVLKGYGNQETLYLDSSE